MTKERDRVAAGAIKPVVLRILHLSHWEWHAIAEEARSPRRREDPVASPPGDPHIDLAQILETLDDDAITAVWQSWIEPREAWLLRAFEETDALPEEHNGGLAFASGACRVKSAIPLSLRHMQAPSERLALRLLHVGIEERDPSFNATFLGPAVWYLGVKRVLREYNQVFKEGDRAARSAVLRALYHTRYDEQGMHGSPREAEETAEVHRTWREMNLVTRDARAPMQQPSPRTPWWKFW